MSPSTHPFVASAQKVLVVLFPIFLVALIADIFTAQAWIEMVSDWLCYAFLTIWCAKHLCEQWHNRSLSVVDPHRPWRVASFGGLFVINTCIAGVGLDWPGPWATALIICALLFVLLMTLIACSITTPPSIECDSECGGCCAHAREEA
jgi:hypothetical protein